MKLTPANIKKRVVGGRTPAALESDPATLALGQDGDGMMWATNRYWLTPASRVTPLLAHFNQPWDKPGVFKVNGTVSAGGIDSVQPETVLSKAKDCTVPLAPALTGNHQSYVRFSDRLPWQAAYRSAEGFSYGVNAEDWEWLRDLTSFEGGGSVAAGQFGLAENERFGEARLMVKPETDPGDTRWTLAAIVADVIKTIEPSRYEGRTRIDAVTENLGPRTVGMVMATRLGKS